MICLFDFPHQMLVFSRPANKQKITSRFFYITIVKNIINFIAKETRKWYHQRKEVQTKFFKKLIGYRMFSVAFNANSSKGNLKGKETEKTGS